MLVVGPIKLSNQMSCSQSHGFNIVVVIITVSISSSISQGQVALRCSRGNLERSSANNEFGVRVCACVTHPSTRSHSRAYADKAAYTCGTLVEWMDFLKQMLVDAIDADKPPPPPRKRFTPENLAIAREGYSDLPVNGFWEVQNTKCLIYIYFCNKRISSDCVCQ